jgi:hypothetical protein
MKKRKLIITSTIALFVISFSFCKDIKLERTQQELLNAKWSIASMKYNVVENGIHISSRNYDGSSTDYMAFSNNNKIYRLIHGTKDVVPYTLIPGNKIICDEDTMIIKSLTEKICVLNLKNGSNNNYSEQIINLKK